MLQKPHTEDTARWKQRMRTPMISGWKIARGRPDRGLISSNLSGVQQIYAWQVATGQTTRLTDRPQGLWGYAAMLSPDGQYVYYLDDTQGNEIGHLVRIPFEGGPTQDVTPTLPPYVISYESDTYCQTFSRSGNRLGCTLVNDDGFSLYCIDIGPDDAIGTPRRLYRSPSLAVGPALSYGGEIAALAVTERTGKIQYSLLAFDVASGELLGELWDEPEGSIQPEIFSPLPGDMRLAATTNVTGTKRPLIWNPRTGEREDLALAELDGEITVLDWSPAGTHLLLCQVVLAAQRLYTYDLVNRTLKPLNAPRGLYWNVKYRSEAEILAQWADATHTNRLIILDSSTGEQTSTLLSLGEAPESRRSRSITFMSSGDQEIQGWLILPEGEGPFPTILETHGGPDVVQMEVFSPRAQAWLDHGYAHLSINYRGSTTFGRDFQRQIWGHIGDWEVDDMVAARQWLIDHKVALPDLVFLTGWSYGGYLTLLALGKQPELWAGGMAGIAVADRVLQYEDASEKHKGYLVALFEGTPQEKPEQWARSSPLSYVEQVRAPVLIIQGRNDTRCPARQVEVYQQRMQALGKPIEVSWFDSGHGSAATEQGIEHQELMLRFAYDIVAKHA